MTPRFIFRKALFLPLFISLASFSYSQISTATTSLIGYSKYFKTVDSVDPANITIYAGMTSAACVGDGVTTCDSCAGQASPFTAANSPVCNNQQIYPTLPFSVSISTDNTAITASSYVAVIFNGTSRITPTYTGTLGPNSTVTISIPWSSICQAGSTDSACKKSFNNLMMSVGFDKDGNSGNTLTEFVKFSIKFRYVEASQPQTWCAAPTAAPATYEGFCDFFVFPGDEKVYLDTSKNITGNFKVEDLQTGSLSTTADPSDMSYNFLRVHYAPGEDFSVLSPSSPFVDIVTTGTEISTAKVTGLTNDVKYVFVTANVDQAGNVTRFANVADLSSIDGCLTIGADGRPGCGSTQAAKPQLVQGLLENKNCFIATAAFGSSMSPYVEILRNFRDLYLQKTTLGQNFVEFYYKHSPSLANFIEKSMILKFFVRIFLWPFVLFAKLSLLFGFSLASCLFVILGSSITFTIFYFKRKNLLKKTILPFKRKF